MKLFAFLFGVVVFFTVIVFYCFTMIEPECVDGRDDAVACTVCETTAGWITSWK